MLEAERIQIGERVALKVQHAEHSCHREPVQRLRLGSAVACVGVLMMVSACSPTPRPPPAEVTAVGQSDAQQPGISTASASVREAQTGMGLPADGDVAADAGEGDAADEIREAPLDSTDVAPDSPGTTPTADVTPKATAQPNRLGSWNIKKLGHGTATRFDLVAQVIEQRFDIVAIIEVMQKQGGHPGYERLMTELGDGWSAFVTDQPRPNTGTGNAEFYAIAWRPGIIRPCAGWSGLRYVEDNDGGPNGTGENRFEREPAFGCFAAGPDANTVGTDFVLAVYHATWADGDTPTIEGEVRNLGLVFDAMAAAVPGERDLFVLGDFNLVPADLAQAIAFADLTEGTGSTLNGQGVLTDNLYDHLIVHEPSASRELLGRAQVLDVRDVAESPRAFFTSVSDHLPLAIEVDVAGPDDD